MKKRAILVAALIVAMVGSPATPASAHAPAFHHLDPGGKPTLTEKVPVNIVFLGYDRAQVDEAQFTAGLARTYEPQTRSAQWYGRTDELGITYTYDYRVTYADSAYRDAFFGRLGQLATPAPLTTYQQQYNDQEKNVLDVTGNHYIDAPTVEKYLAYHPPAGVDTRHDTIFLINWYGRTDFQFHVYTKTGEPDPDTGYDYGAGRDSRKMMAWGGTTADDAESGLGSTRRVWFADLSAGPDAFMANYIVDRLDVDGDGVPDRRMPTSWEYTDGGFRPPSALAGDLAALTRYVGLDLLMTTSPLSPVDLPSGLPKSINLDSNTYEGWPGVDASAQYIKPGVLLAKLSKLRWRNELSYDSQDLAFTGKAKECFEGEFVTDTPCYDDQQLPPGADLFLNATENDATLRDDDGLVDYELPYVNYATDGTYPTTFLGYTDDNWTDGTQSYVFTFLTPALVNSGSGLTGTMIHEGGHYLGLGHPHDGWDSESGTDLEPTGDFYFAYVGDEVNSVMSYINVNFDFSQFDRDNSDRFLTAAYQEGANRLTAAVLAAPNARRGYADLHAADGLIGRSQQAFAQHDYRTAYAQAEQAYDRVVTAAEKAGADPKTAARAMHAEAEQARASGLPQDPPLGSGPRSLP